MNIDWDILGKWDVLFGIAGGIVLAFSGIRWIANHIKSSRFTGLLAWAIVGSSNEQKLIQTTKGIFKLAFAALVWGLLGAIIAVFLVLAFILVQISLGITVFGIREGLFLSAIFGALTGIIMRLVLWPLWSSIDTKWRIHQESKKNHEKIFQRQSKRVESKLNRSRHEDQGKKK